MKKYNWFPIPILHNKIFISANFGPTLEKSAKNFGPKSPEMKILFCKVSIGNKYYYV